MDEAEHGVIYVSLGSIVTPKSMPDVGEKIVDALKNLPQRVIMKWDKNLLQHIPDNILFDDWLPQADILSKENFIPIHIMEFKTFAFSEFFHPRIILKYAMSP